MVFFGIFLNIQFNSFRYDNQCLPIDGCGPNWERLFFCTVLGISIQNLSDDAGNLDVYID